MHAIENSPSTFEEVNFDLGIRNVLIRNFNPLEIRPDVGALWENFCVMEKIKTISNQRKFANYYFWRTWQQQEIDFIVEKEGRLEAFEFKWAENKRSFPLLFSELYPHSIEQVVTKKNFQSFILDSL